MYQRGRAVQPFDREDSRLSSGRRSELHCDSARVSGQSGSRGRPFRHAGDQNRIMPGQGQESCEDGSTRFGPVGQRSRSVDRRDRGQLLGDTIGTVPGEVQYQVRPSGRRSHSVDRKKILKAEPNVMQRHERNIHYLNASKPREQGQYRDIRPIPRGMHTEARQGPMLAHHIPPTSLVQDKDSWEICMKNLSDRRCMFGRNCRRHHCNETYQWQYKNSYKEDDSWHNFFRETNTDLEKNYCQPDRENCLIKFWRGVEVAIIFDEESMYGEGQNTRLKVRRLSTISSEIFSGPLSIWTTVWKWYWENPDSGGWSEYGAEDKHGSKSTLNSEVLEQHYQENPRASIPFTTNNFDYILNFDILCQENVRMSTLRRVRRRPRFFEKEELKKRKFQSRFTSRSVIKIPENWTAGTFMSEEELCNYYNRVEEYDEVENLFSETMKGTKRIRRIERIENGELWMCYKQKQLQMARKSSGKDVNEMKLFHGTQAELTEPICREGFDFRFSGTNIGALYGRGSYFAREATYSDCYAEKSSTSGRQKLFVARVLVGEYSKGKKSYVRPPARCAENPHNLFDSCVDNERNPKIFVIFTLEQVYPEYLITYK